MSDKVFKLGLYTAEHDIPYHERALTDLAAKGVWIFDTDGKEKKVNATVYDIEITRYGEEREAPIDIIGYSRLQISFASSKNLENEDFFFEIIDLPEGEEEVVQLVAENENDEIKNLVEFTKIISSSDIISGHNILGFDNMEIYERMKKLMQKSEILSKEEIQHFKNFIDVYTKRDQSFHFGVANNVAIFYPSSFDTFHAARKFYALDEYSLNGLVNFLGVGVEDRIHLTPDKMAIDDRTLKYNEQDVIEEVRVFLNLVQQGLPLAFITGMPFELLFPSGATKMWDYMAMIRAAYHKKIMPALCRVYDVAKGIGKYGKSKKEIAEKVRREGASKEIARVAKYGDEMPDWVEYPFLIYDEKNKDIAYHFPGGMTIKPDRDANSHFIPWYSVLVADVGAMYPTILRAINAGADTVTLAKNEEPDDWIWLKKVPQKFLEEVRPICKEGREEFIDKGVLIGVKIAKEPGVVNLAMKGIMDFIKKLKEEMKQKEGKEKRILSMMYQSLKAARNAGTHGILSAPLVSCRQFNLWGAALITTKGQQILYDTLKTLENNGARVVYGDTDGIYVACSSSASKRLRNALGTNEKDSRWIIQPDRVREIIDHCNEKWRKLLGYREFELEVEEHDAMIFVKHKNYLIFDVEDGKVKMITKGNNFKGSDKPDIARIVLREIMMDVLKENLEWNDEEEARQKVREAIMRITLEKVKEIDIEKFDMDAFTLVQSVQPHNRYKPNPNGSPSVYGERAAALERLLGKITIRRKFKFVVTKKPLPGIKNPTKSGVKPIHFMYPLELLKDRNELDMEWYKEMIKNYIQGAFGLPSLEKCRQYGLDRWM
ncbi:MAG: DNA polymerase elongation subunit (family B) [Thermoplasmata archaeon]|nr:MAG: DNA polymerase elongation subunit (family B) [Thermoplasmata archaeon]